MAGMRNLDSGFWKTGTIPRVPLDNSGWNCGIPPVETPSRNQYPPRFVEDWASGSYFQGTRGTLKGHLSMEETWCSFCLLGDALLSKIQIPPEDRPKYLIYPL
jgi:hypothetical protein